MTNYVTLFIWKYSIIYLEVDTMKTRFTKILALLLVFVTVLSVAACNTPADDGKNETTTQTTTDETTVNDTADETTTEAEDETTTEPAPTDADKLAYAKADLALPEELTKDITIAGEFKLPFANATYPDVTMAWTSDNTACAIAADGTTLTVTLPKADTTVTLTATLTCGEESDTASFTVKLIAPELRKAYGETAKSGKVYYFTNYLPEQFDPAKTTESILVNAGDFVVEKSLGNNKSNVGTIYHHYIDDSNKDISDKDKVLYYEFNAPKAGQYDICFSLRVKDSKQRGATITVNNSAAIPFDHSFTDADLALVQINSNNQGTWVTGFTVELREGKNILKITYCPGIEKSVHFRDIYFAEHVPFNTEDVDYTLLG